jgi:hypothetical protein
MLTSKCSANINKNKDNINMFVKRGSKRINKGKYLKNRWIRLKQADLEELDI